MKAKKILGWLIFLGAYIAGYFYMYFRNVSGERCDDLVFCTVPTSLLANSVAYEFFIFLWLILFPILGLVWTSTKRKYTGYRWISLVDWGLMFIGAVWIIGIIRVKGIFWLS